MRLFYYFFRIRCLKNNFIGSFVRKWLRTIIGIRKQLSKTRLLFFSVINQLPKVPSAVGAGDAAASPNKFDKIWLKFGQIWVNSPFGQIWAKSKSFIPKNSRSPTAMRVSISEDATYSFKSKQQTLFLNFFTSSKRRTTLRACLMT